MAGLAMFGLGIGVTVVAAGLAFSVLLVMEMG